MKKQQKKNTQEFFEFKANTVIDLMTKGGLIVPTDPSLDIPHVDRVVRFVKSEYGHYALIPRMSRERRAIKVFRDKFFTVSLALSGELYFYANAGIMNSANYDAKLDAIEDSFDNIISHFDEHRKAIIEAINCQNTARNGEKTY